MKSPLYILAVLLPLATELALGSPTAEAEFEELEERGRGGHKDWDDHNGWNHDRNPCEVKRSYPYYKYPCDSSVTTGMSQVGAIFTPSCKYQNGNSGVWYLAPKGWVKDSDKPRRCPGTNKPCT
ncbi:hypothetical protein MYU51_002725 [Penicillium brevicompactum]|uniref:uncharacterized protein n=1 Tax=Penicillium brevicompactum TaxID=5074 RepID=UPI002541FFDC|nr:uncharacterized protein N7506_011141 [Penicillium brevicompactum]KAJ5322011.1 hypothetical protein N7506_011141 [Penicillium brevicompactum]